MSIVSSSGAGPVIASSGEELREAAFGRRTPMSPAGYMLKKVCLKPSWIGASAVKDIYSVSGCISECFADYISHWRHNGYWLFNRPSDMDEIIKQAGIDRSGLTLFYYEIYEQQFDERTKTWSMFAPEASFVTEVKKPTRSRLEGFDVVSFSVGSSPECSPLSCNSLADEIKTNQHCLMETLEDARAALEAGRFDNSEPGPFRIFAVYTVED